MSDRPKPMGIYADIEQRRVDAYDSDLEKRIRTWMEALLKKKLSNPDFRESLMDGVALCEVINCIEPNAIKKIRNSPVMLFRRENFMAFCTAAEQIGVPHNDLCRFEDIYDNKNMSQCLIMLLSLARKVQYRPGYKGPILQDAVKQGTKIEREFTEQQLREAQNTLGLGTLNLIEGQKVVEKGKYQEHGIIMNPDENPIKKK